MVLGAALVDGALVAGLGEDALPGAAPVDGTFHTAPPPTQV